MEPTPLEGVIRNVDSRLKRVEQILPTLATREDLREEAGKLREEASKLATKEELREAVSTLATKDELKELGTDLRAEMREEGERTRRHFDVVAERLEDKITLLAEGQAAIHEKMDRGFGEVRSELTKLDRRVTSLEARRRR